MTDAIPDEVGVLGGGRMGAGIAHAFVVAGARVTVVERDPESAAAAEDRVRRALDRSVERGTTAEPAPALAARLTVATDAAAFASCGLVVEAVPEDLRLKVDSLRRVEAVLGAQAWLATNTSSLSVTALAASLAEPSRVIGLHFFNPVPASSLVEIVVAEHTDPRLPALATEWVRALGKTPIVARDVPGFASSRLGVAIALEAMRMLEEGVASAEDIDRAMTLGYRHPMGPLATSDLVGLDVRLGIAEYLHTTLGDRFAPPRILREKVAAGHLGQKTGTGFFDWPRS